MVPQLFAKLVTLRGHDKCLIKIFSRERYAFTKALETELGVVQRFAWL